MTSNVEPEATLRLMTLNIVRSTRVPLPAWAVPRAVKRRTHALLGAALDRARPDVLALQEVDRATADRLVFGDVRVGDPDRHGAYLATRSRAVATETRRFRAQGFFRDKGYSSATIVVPGFASPVRVVCVHLDAFSKQRRSEQALELATALSRERGPLVVLGDLNEEDEPDGVIAALGRRLDLRTRPAPAPTYAFLGVARMLDWVLISSDLELRAIEVLPTRMSDHRGVVATIGQAS